MKYSCVVVAAGSGSRSGLNFNKVFYKIDNETIIEKSLKHFINDQDCIQIILVISENDQQTFEDLKLSNKVEFVYGGKERSDSVYNGLLKVKADYVIIHDGARPYLKNETINKVKLALKQYDGVVVMVESIDTVKFVENNIIKETLDRTKLYNAQTPQAFKTSVIIGAYKKLQETDIKVTDDAQVVEFFSDVEVYVVEGDYSNIKVTTESDLK